MQLFSLLSNRWIGNHATYRTALNLLWHFRIDTTRFYFTGLRLWFSCWLHFLVSYMNLNRFSTLIA